jgi:hypothetical protein
MIVAVSAPEVIMVAVHHRPVEVSDPEVHHLVPHEGRI